MTNASVFRRSMVWLAALVAAIFVGAVSFAEGGNQAGSQTGANIGSSEPAAGTLPPVAQTQTAAGPAREIAVDLGGGVKMEMVLIPAGSFTMGSQNGEPNEKPAHTVTITKSFYIGKYPVTQAQWQAVMGTNPSSFKSPTNPVEQISFNDCHEFAGRASAKVGGGIFRLPTEAEWEYACRAGTTTQYYWGDDGNVLGDYAWYGPTDKNPKENSGGATHTVGQKKPNAWGLYDMIGNVWQRCEDRYDEGYYAKSPASDPTGATRGTSRVIRGGSWAGGYPGSYRSAFRDFLYTSRRDDNFGLRLVKNQ